MKTQNILDHLEKFVALRAIVISGSIRKASKVLRISQPSLSIKIKNLELALGFQLLKRSREGIVLTEAGQKAFVFATDIIDRSEGLKVDFEQNDSLTGHVRIGIYDSIARYFWPDFYKYFSKKYPGIIITLSTGRSKMIEGLIVERYLDMGIVIAPGKSKETSNTPLYKDKMSCFSTKKFANKIWSLDANARSLAYKPTSENISLILFSQALLGNGLTLERHLSEAMIRNLNIHRVENFEIARAFCLESIGMAILPNRVVQEEYKKRELIKIKMSSSLQLNFGEHPIGLCINKVSDKLPVMATVTDEIRGFIVKRQK